MHTHIHACIYLSLYIYIYISLDRTYCPFKLNSGLNFHGVNYCSPLPCADHGQPLDPAWMAWIRAQRRSANVCDVLQMQRVYD